MGRAGGGSRSFGGGRSGGSRSFGGGGRSFSSGSRSFGSSGGRSSMSGGFGGIGGFSGGHIPRPHHRPVRPVIFHPGYSGRKTIIINNSGNHTYQGQNTSTNNGPETYTNTSNQTANAAQQTYTAPKPITPEQRMERAKRLAKEAADSKKNFVTFLLIAVILFVFGVIASGATKNKEVFEKISLVGTVNVGYATDEINGASGTRLTEKACKKFYKNVGVPVYFYTEEYYDGSDEVAYANELYEKLFKDENHLLMVYCDNLDVWSYCSGDNVPAGIVNAEALLDHMESYWFDYSLSYDQVLAKSITAYQKSLTGSSGDGATFFSVILFVAGGIMLIVAVYTYASKDKEAKRYEEEAKTIQAEILLSKPLETFGNQEVEDLKDKYDNM